MSITLGSYVRCKYTGYTGYVTGRAEYLDRAPLCLVVADKLSSESTKEEWIPERRLEITTIKAQAGWVKGE